jgi:prepilin-type processing-associated H-X9-DG protein
MRCANNLKQLALGIHNYAENHPERYCPSAAFSGEGPPERRLSWMVSLLPYVEQEEVFKQFDPTKTWDAAENKPAARSRIDYFLCPATGPRNEQPYGFSNYVGISGVGEQAAWLPLTDARCGFFGYDRRIQLADVKDGISNTMMIVETAAQNGPRASGGEATVRGVKPNVQPYVAENGQFGRVHRLPDAWRFATLTPRANVAMADGSVRFLESTIGPQVFETLATIAGGEQIPDDF